MVFPLIIQLVSATSRAAATDGSINIFHGGYLPALEQVIAAASHHGLKILDIENMSGHCEDTLKKRRRAFFANVATVRTHYDERFIRVWELYVAGCECFFGHKLVWYFSCSLATIIQPRYWGDFTSRKKKIVFGIYCARRFFLATHPS